MSAESAELKRLVAELDEIEFWTASDVEQYVAKTRKACKALATSLEYAADELKAALQEVPPPPGESPRSAHVRAKAVSKHLRRAASGVRQGGTESIKTWRSLVKHYEHILKPAKSQRRKIDLTT